MGGKSLVTSNDGTAAPYAGACAGAVREPLRARSTPSPASAHTMPVTNAPRSPAKATTAPQMNAPRPCDSVEERGERSHHRRAVGIAHAVEREDQQCGVHQRHAAREHDRADHEPGERRPDRDHADTRGHDHQRERGGGGAAQPVGQPRTEDAHHEDEHAVEREDPTRAHVQRVHVERYEGGETRERDHAEEQHGARPHRAAVPEVGRARLGGRAFDLHGERAEPGRDDRERGRDGPHEPVAPAAVTNGAVQHRAEHRSEREPAVDRDRPVAHGFAPPVRGREVRDHRRRTHEESRLAEPGDDAQHHEEPQRVHQAVTRGGGADDQRAADDRARAARPCRRTSPRRCAAPPHRPRRPPLRCRRPRCRRRATSPRSRAAPA